MTHLLCVSTGLTSSEWAAWIQAIGSILAIAGSVWLVIWQTGRQLTAAAKLEESRRWQAQLDLAQTLRELSARAITLIEHVRDRFKDRESVWKIATKEVYFHRDDIEYLERSVIAIPLYSLPHRIVIFPMHIAAILTQMRSNVDQTLERHSTMDGADFQSFFDTLRDAYEHMRLVSADIAREIAKLSG